MLQVLILQSAGAQEDHLQFLAFSNQLSEQADFFGLVLALGGLHLVKLVGADWHRVTRLEFFLVEGVPIEEKVGDRAVVLPQVANQSAQLAVRQAVIAESTSETKQQTS